jgi:hypothetical protein
MIKKLLASGALASAVVLMWGITAASAHHPEVAAVTVCYNNAPAIQVTSTAWDTTEGDAHRVNTNVQVHVTGPGIDQTLSGAFTGPTFSFVRTFVLPNSAMGQTLTVRATAVAPWGPSGEFGSEGTFRETTVTVQNPCPVSSTTTAASTTTTPATGGGTVTTTVSPTTVAPTTSQVATQVEGAVETPPAPAAGAQLAFTGANTTASVAAVLVLVAGGLVLVQVSRRRRTD